MKTKPEEIVYPIPLSNGHVVTVRNLPAIFSKADADKVCAVLMALVTKP